jgi:WD40 repeat protein
MLRLLLFIAISTVSPAIITAQIFPTIAIQKGKTDQIQNLEVLRSGVGVYMVSSSENLVTQFSEQDSSWIVAVRDGVELWRHEIGNGRFINNGRIYATQDSGVAVIALIGATCLKASVDSLLFMWFDQEGRVTKRHTLEISEVTDSSIEFMADWAYLPQFDQFLIVQARFTDPGFAMYTVSKANPATVELVCFDQNDEFQFSVKAAVDPTDNNRVWLATTNQVYRYEFWERVGVYPAALLTQGNLIAKVSQDGRFLLSTSGDGGIKVVEVRDAQDMPMYEVVSDTGPANNMFAYFDADFLPDGRIMAMMSYPFSDDTTLTYRIWPSQNDLQTLPTPIGVRTSGGTYHISATSTHLTLGGVDSHFGSMAFNSFYSTAAIRNFDINTGKPTRDWMDVEISGARTLPDTWGHKLKDAPFTYRVECSGIEVTIRNNGPQPLQSVELCAYPPSALFSACELPVLVQQRFEGLNLAPGQSTTLTLEGFSHPALMNNQFGFDTSMPSIAIWASAPNDLPDSAPYNDGVLLTNFFNILPSPGTFRIFPNPVSEDYLFVTIEQEELYQVTFWIYDALGRVVRNQPVPNQGEYYYVPVQGLLPGVYYIKWHDQLVRFVRI